MSDILKFFDNWINTKDVITEPDTDKLSRFVYELGIEIDYLSIEPNNGGTNLILYSGASGNTPIWKTAESASQYGQGFYYISDTVAGEFMNDEKVWMKLQGVARLGYLCIDKRKSMLIYKKHIYR